ncbi:unnamed protein product [Owenia fusiformis]|uniref:Peptidase S8/S53 domain-containing protein n=1 Tax=Owenia fusiformis TaxID=6347 RepID=A0A8J1U6U7_OWEFU|nr:unnamed protein product [Owenia fusiformis]
MELNYIKAALVLTILAYLTNNTTGRIGLVNGRNDIKMGNRAVKTGQYILKLKEEMTNGQAGHKFSSLRNRAKEMGCKTKNIRELYTHQRKAHRSNTLRLYSIECDNQSFLEELRTDAEIDSVTENIILDTQSCAFTDTTKFPSSWGLDRIDQELLLDDSFMADYDPVKGYDSVDVYIIDTGIYDDHPAFQKYGNIVSKYNSVSQLNEAADFPPGHGTAMAGIIGGEYGVAPGVRMHAVKVFDDFSYATIASLMAGISWVQQQIQASNRKSIVNISLGATFYTCEPLEDAVANLVQEGVPVALAAGNSYNDACNNTPARSPVGITVGGSDMNDDLWVDTLSYGSSYGSCVDIIAPSKDILAPKYWGGLTYELWSGTSMATPYVAGAMAAYWHDNPNKTYIEVMDWVKESSTRDILKNLPTGTPNKLLRTTGCPLPS